MTVGRGWSQGGTAFEDAFITSKRLHMHR